MPEDMENQEDVSTEPVKHHRGTRFFEPNLGRAKGIGRGLPAAGDIREPGADIAVNPGEERAEIQRIIERTHMIEFVEEYGEHYGDTTELLRWLDKAASEDISDFNTEDAKSFQTIIFQGIHALFNNAKKDARDKFADKMWKQKFPKYAQGENAEFVTGFKKLKKYLQSEKKGKRYEYDAYYAENINRKLEALESFKEYVNEEGTFESIDPEFREMSKKFKIIDGGLRDMASACSALSFGNKGSRKADDMLGKRKDPMKVIGKDKDDPIFVRDTSKPSVTVPRERGVPLPAHIARAVGRGERDIAARQAADIEKKMDKLSSGDMTTSKQKKLRDLQMQHEPLRRKASGDPGFVVRKKSSLPDTADLTKKIQEAMDKFVNRILEIASADKKPRWWDGL